MMVMIIITFN